MANELEIIVGAKDKASPVLGKISGNIGDMGRKMTKTGTIMMAAGVGIIGSLFAITKKASSTGDAIAKMSQRTGIGTVALSELKHAADLSDSSLEGLESGIKRMQRTIYDASTGMASAADSLTALGFTFEDVAGKSPEEQFNMLTMAIANIEDPTLKAAIAQEIFGRAGTDLLPMLAGGAAGLQAMKDEAHTLGVVFDEEAAAKCEAFEDALTNLKTSLAGAGSHIAEVLMPIITDLLNNKIIPTITKIADWIKTNENLVLTLAKLGLALAVGGAVLLGIGAVARAIVAVNAALIIMHALAGPGGWAKLGIGAAIAAGGIFAMKQMMSDIGSVEVPGAQHGGVIRKRSIIQVAEAGPEAIIPLSNFGMAGGSAPYNVTVNVSGSVITENQLTDVIYEKLLQKKLRNASLGLA